MSIINFVVVVALVGVLLWAVTTYLPMDPKVKQFLSIAVVILLVVWFLAILGVLPMLDAPIGRIR